MYRALYVAFTTIWLFYTLYRQLYTKGMQYIHSSTSDIIVHDVANTLLSHLGSGQKVLWLVSGGSAIAVEVRIAELLQAHDVSRLSVGLIDERYGPQGHADENYQQLITAGFPLHINRVLNKSSIEVTTQAFGTYIDQTLHEVDFSLGFFGVGADGHTAGIKPHSPAVSSTTPAIFYEWDDHTRITITPTTIRRLDEAVVYANGQEKASTLQSVLSNTLPIDAQPAQILKEVTKSALYTDCQLQV